MEPIEITKKDFLFEKVKFVVKAREKDKKGRDNLKLLCVEEKEGSVYAYCADGFRLHIADISPSLLNNTLPAGNYAVEEKATRIKLTPTASEFPNIWDLLGKMEYLDTVNLFHFDAGLATIIRALPSNRTVNHDYIHDLGDGGFKFYKSGEATMLFFHDELLGVGALIMPIYTRAQN